MKKGLLISGILVLLLTLGGATIVFAQDENPQTEDPAVWYGCGGMGRGMMGDWNGDSAMHELYFGLLAENLGLSTDELEQKLQDGQTLQEVALELGWTEDDFSEMFAETHTSALKQAVEEGILTQEQANWMSERFSARTSSSMFSGTHHAFMYSEDYLEVAAGYLDLSVEELQERLQNGETLWSISSESGMSLSDYQAMQTEIHDLAEESGVFPGWQADNSGTFMGGRGHFGHHVMWDPED